MTIPVQAQNHKLGIYILTNTIQIQSHGLVDLLGDASRTARSHWLFRVSDQMLPDFE